MSRRVPLLREARRSSPVCLSVGRTQSSSPCSQVRSSTLPTRFFQVCAFSFCNVLGIHHHLDGFPIVHRTVTVRNAIKTDGTIEHSPGFDIALKNVRQKVLDVSPHRSNPPADHNIVVKCWLGPWHRLLLRTPDAPHRPTRTSYADRSIHRLFKPDAFQH